MMRANTGGPDMSSDLRADIDSLFARAELNRREMVVTSLAAGFALAVQPVSAATISTDVSGISAGEVKIPVADEKIPAYRAMPDKGGPFPVVLVVQEIFGVHEHIKDVCRRLAKLGFMAIAPELYARQGDVAKLQSFDEIRPIVARVPDVQVMSDLDACVDFAKDSGKGDVTKLHITGFCWGGRIVWLEGDKTELQPEHPLDVVAKLNAPVLGLYAGKDTGIPLASVEKMRTALKNSKVPSEIVVYTEAQHGFHADYRPSYKEDDAKDGWQRLLSWFKKFETV
jgi:carboxymethylenebutenolidase